MRLSKLRLKLFKLVLLEVQVKPVNHLQEDFYNYTHPPRWWSSSILQMHGTYHHLLNYRLILHP